MSRIAYVNGAYVPLAGAAVGIEDRGFQFADGVYEGIAVRKGRLIDLEPHLQRLWRSMGELDMDAPMAVGPMRLVLSEVVRQNRIADGFLYVQVTRGEARRDHAFPAFSRPSLIVTCRRFDYDAVFTRAATGVKAKSVPDIRWGRCDIKSISLLPNVLAKQAARSEGAFEAVLIDTDGNVTEGSSTNVWMVDGTNTLVTRATSDNILPGITRAVLADLAAEHQVRVDTRPFSLEEAYQARELFLTSTTSGVMPIVALDGRTIASGRPGPLAGRLLAAYKTHMDSCPRK